jgi:hypothetical protein
LDSLRYTNNATSVCSNGAYAAVNSFPRSFVCFSGRVFAVSDLSLVLELCVCSEDDSPTQPFPDGFFLMFREFAARRCLEYAESSAISASISIVYLHPVLGHSYSLALFRDVPTFEYRIRAPF